MKLRNKRTGEIVVFGEGIVDLNQIGCKNVAEMIARGWEDYEGPKEFWCIGQDGVIFSDVDTITKDYADRLKSIGNYFETEEEAEKAVERLRAWKRLKDKGFKITFVRDGGYVYLQADWGLLLGDFSDVELLFGGEE